MKRIRLDLPQLATGVAFAAVSAWLIVDGNLIGWLGLIFALLLIAHVALDARTQRKLRREKSATAASFPDLAEEGRLFADHLECWRLVLENTQGAWVLFENGTVVICGTCIEPQEAAVKIIDEYSSILPGTGTADLSIRLYAALGVWVVAHGNGAVLNYISTAECPLQTAAGLLAREIAQEDAMSRVVIHVHAG